MDTPHFGSAECKPVSVFDEVASEEDREHDLGELSWLKGERPDVDPDLGAVDSASNSRHQWHHRNDEGRKHRDIYVATEDAVVSDHDEDDRCCEDT